MKHSLFCLLMAMICASSALAQEGGVTTSGEGKPSADTDNWPQFRGANRDAISPDAKGLLRSWPAEGPKVLWTIEGLGQGYSGPAILRGRVYFNDYDEKAKQWMCRCVSLADGREIWRWSYPQPIRPYHGITRSIPVVDDKFVVSLDPKCVLHCLDATTGKQLWFRDLVTEFGVRIPQWYNGQCPLNEADRVILGIGGKEVLMAALDKATGKSLWQTPNPDRIQMSHASVMPMTLAGKKQYVWGTLGGVVGVDAVDGKLLWRGPEKDAWKGSTAVAPSAVAISGDRVFMTSSYKSGSVMLKVESGSAGFVCKPVFTRTFEQFASDCHTPIVIKDHLFAVNGERFTCLSPEGKIVWASPEGTKFGLGSFMMADGMFFILEGDTGKLHLVEASLEGWKELASAQVLSGAQVWAPMALANGKLVLRDLNKMVCVQVDK